MKKIGKLIVARMPWSLFLAVLPNKKSVTLGKDQLEPSPIRRLLYKALWMISCHGKVQRLRRKVVRYNIGDKQFTMALNIARAPECGYYYFDPTPGVTELISSCLARGTMVDIGANVGFHTLTAALFFDRVYAFEPTPETYASLDKNVKMNGFSNVALANVALASSNGSAILHRDSRNCGANSLIEEGICGSDQGTVTVATQRLDDFVAQTGIQRVDFIKIDVEGFEAEVLEGAKETIATHSPVLFVELLTDSIAQRVRGILPPGYRIWDPATRAEMSLEDYSDNQKRPRDIVFSVQCPYSD